MEELNISTKIIILLNSLVFIDYSIDSIKIYHKQCTKYRTQCNRKLSIF